MQGEVLQNTLMIFFLFSFLSFCFQGGKEQNYQCSGNLKIPRRVLYSQLAVSWLVLIG